jgi:hypothetical protein
MILLAFIVVVVVTLISVVILARDVIVIVLRRFGKGPKVRARGPVEDLPPEEREP